MELQLLIPVAFLLVQLSAGLETKMFQLTMPNVRPYRVNIVKVVDCHKQVFNRCKTRFHMLRASVQECRKKIIFIDRLTAF